MIISAQQKAQAPVKDLKVLTVSLQTSGTFSAMCLETYSVNSPAGEEHALQKDKTFVMTSIYRLIKQSSALKKKLISQDGKTVPAVTEQAPNPGKGPSPVLHAKAQVRQEYNRAFSPSPRPAGNAVVMER